jgi:Heavy metal binding domain
MKRICSALAASALTFTLGISDAQAAPAVHDGDGHAHAPHGRTGQARASRTRRRASKARRGSARRASIIYACPMHPDMRSRTPGECPKCGMTMVAVGRKAKAASGAEDGAHPNP